MRHSIGPSSILICQTRLTDVDDAAACCKAGSPDPRGGPQNAQNSMGNPNMYAKFFLTPDLPHPAPPNLATGTTPSQGVIFFQKPHRCVFKMISATRGSL